MHKLKLARVEKFDSSLYDALLQEGLRSLEIQTEPSPVFNKFFKKRGTIRSLETLVWITFHQFGPGYNPQQLDFLETNVHLSTLRLEGASNHFLEGKLLPLISTTFFQLKPLCLAWRDGHISDRSLEMISHLGCLEHFHLITEETYNNQLEWRKDHGRMLKHIRKLNQLESLAFTDHGAYYTPDSNGYYPSKRHDDNTYGWSSDEKRTWEIVHCAWMGSVARHYAKEMPLLEWIYMGRLPFGITLGREVVSLSMGKDDECRGVFKDLFG